MSIGLTLAVCSLWLDFLSDAGFLGHECDSFVLRFRLTASKRSLTTLAGKQSSSITPTSFLILDSHLLFVCDLNFYQILDFLVMSVTHLHSVSDSQLRNGVNAFEPHLLDTLQTEFQQYSQVMFAFYWIYRWWALGLSRTRYLSAFGPTLCQLSTMVSRVTHLSSVSNRGLLNGAHDDGLCGQQNFLFKLSFPKKP